MALDMALEDCIQLQYIQSSGNEVIDLGFIPKPVSNIYECDFDIVFTNIDTSSNYQKNICGCS